MPIWRTITQAWPRLGSRTPTLTDLNCLGLLLAVPILLSAIVSATNCYHHSVSEEYFQIIIGALLLAVSLIGILGAFFHIRWLVWAHIVGLLLLLVLLGVRLTIFAGERPQNALTCPNDHQTSAFAPGRGAADRADGAWKETYRCFTREDPWTSRRDVNAVDRVARFLCAQALLSSMQAASCEEWCMARKNITATIEAMKATTDGSYSDQSRMWVEGAANEDEDEKGLLRRAEKRLFVVLIILLLVYSICGCWNFPPPTIRLSHTTQPQNTSTSISPLQYSARR